MKCVLMRVPSLAIFLGMCVFCPSVALAQQQVVPPAQAASPAVAAAINLSDDYKVIPNIVYRSVGKYDAKLDVYQHSGKGVRPTLLYIHGGAWADIRSKDQYALWFAPFLALGWNAVNVEYRPSGVATAPAAVEDCLCAEHWLFEHAAQYGFDKSQVVVMGHSAGGHLAMMVGMTPANSALRKCGGSAPEKIAAIVNWFGITDVADLIQGVNSRVWARTWIGESLDKTTLAASVSPLAYVRADMPPIISVHGDSDPTVPYSQAVRMDAALQKAGVSHELVTIPGGKHGFYGPVATQQAYAHVFAFLEAHGVPVDATEMKH